MIAKIQSLVLRTMTWIGSHELSTLIGVFLLAAGLWAFAEVADEVTEGDTQTVDEAILLAMRSPEDVTDPLGPRWVEELGRDITALGGTSVLTLISLAITGYLLLQRRNRPALIAIVAVTSSFSASMGLKSLFARSRPDLVPHGSHVHTASFPSGHAMMSAFTYLALGILLARLHSQRSLKAYFISLAIFLTGAVGISRVYLGVHWPTDVLAGWTLGACWAILWWLVIVRLQQKNQI